LAATSLGVALAAVPAAAHEEPLSEFGLRPGPGLGPIFDVGDGLAAAVATARLRDDPTVAPSSVLEFGYRRRIEFPEGRALLLGGDLSIARQFSARRRGGTVAASGGCTAGLVRIDETLTADLNQAGIFFSGEWRQSLGGPWFAEAGGGVGLYRVVARGSLRHHEWCALDAAPTTTAFAGFDGDEFAYVAGCWFGASVGVRLRESVPLLDVRLTARVYLVDGFALSLRSQSDPRTLDLHVQPSYGVIGVTLVLTY
jgi:hypothetical protein